MELKLSNVLCNLDEFKIRYNGLRKSFNTKDHRELVAILNKSGNQLINRKLIDLIFGEFFMDFRGIGNEYTKLDKKVSTYSTGIKYIFDYTEEELNNFEIQFNEKEYFLIKSKDILKKQNLCNHVFVGPNSIPYKDLKKEFIN